MKNDLFKIFILVTKMISYNSQMAVSFISSFQNLVKTKKIIFNFNIIFLITIINIHIISLFLISFVERKI